MAKGAEAHQGWLRQVHLMLAGLWQEVVALSGCQRRAHRGKRKIRSSSSLPPWLPLPRNNFDQEDAETQYEDDEPRNDVWQAVFDNGDELQKGALHPRLGAISVHKGHRTFHHRGVMVCDKCGGYSMWVNRKLRRDCLGNPSKPGMEVFKRMANHETARPGQEWHLSVDVAPPTGMDVARV